MPDPNVSGAVIGRLITYAGRLLDVPFHAVLARHGLSRNSWFLLAQIYASRLDAARPLGHHARLGTLPASSATTAADQLAAHNLLRRVPDPGDRRGVMAEITPAGVRLVEEVRDDLEQAIADVTALYTDDERATLADLLSRIVILKGGEV